MIAQDAVHLFTLHRRNLIPDADGLRSMMQSRAKLIDIPIGHWECQGLKLPVLIAVDTSDMCSKEKDTRRLRMRDIVLTQSVLTLKTSNSSKEKVFIES